MEPDVEHKVGSCTHNKQTKQIESCPRVGLPACGAHQNRRSWGARGIESCPRVGRTRMWGASESALMGRMCGIERIGLSDRNGIGMERNEA